ncbi:MAG: hypothetical protein ACK4GG_10960, partial [Sphingomonas sp.]
MPTPFFADLVREIAHEGGTGPLTPAGAVPGHRRFAGVGGLSFGAGVDDPRGDRVRASVMARLWASAKR